MLGAKYGFVQSMDCAVQTMDPYFVQAIHGLCVHILLNFFIIESVDSIIESVDSISY